MKMTTHVAAILGLCAFAACDGDGEGHRADELTVMTLNAYYGFDVNPLLEAEDPQLIPILAAQAFGQLLATDFPDRAAAMAAEIERRNPDVIGLQEVALIRVQSPGDAVEGGSTSAETVLFDHLGILLEALAARGLNYVVAGKVANVDVELPMVTGEEPTFDDIRLTDFDVLLVRGDGTVSNVTTANYDARLSVPGLGIEVPRGYVGADVEIGGRGPYRVVTTHLEDLPFEDIQLAQAVELASVLASESKPVVLVGDFNSPAPQGATVGYLESQGFVDAWSKNVEPHEGGGLTWGHDAGLADDSVGFTMRIDLIFIRPGRRTLRSGFPRSGAFGQVSCDVWGDEPDEKTANGLWPSDHAAVIAEIRLVR